jgi:uncharacterized membrane protein
MQAVEVAVLALLVVQAVLFLAATVEQELVQQLQVQGSSTLAVVVVAGILLHQVR